MSMEQAFEGIYTTSLIAKYLLHNRLLKITHYNLPPAVRKLDIEMAMM